MRSTALLVISITALFIVSLAFSSNRKEASKDWIQRGPEEGRVRPDVGLPFVLPQRGVRRESPQLAEIRGTVEIEEYGDGSRLEDLHGTIDIEIVTHGGIRNVVQSPVVAGRFSVSLDDVGRVMVQGIALDGLSVVLCGGNVALGIGEENHIKCALREQVVRINAFSEASKADIDNLWLVVDRGGTAGLPPDGVLVGPHQASRKSVPNPVFVRREVKGYSVWLGARGYVSVHIPIDENTRDCISVPLSAAAEVVCHIEGRRSLSQYNLCLYKEDGTGQSSPLPTVCRHFGREDIAVVATPGAYVARLEVEETRCDPLVVDSERVLLRAGENELLVLKHPRGELPRTGHLRIKLKTSGSRNVSDVLHLEGLSPNARRCTGQPSQIQMERDAKMSAPIELAAGRYAVHSEDPRVVSEFEILPDEELRLVLDLSNCKERYITCADSVTGARVIPAMYSWVGLSEEDEAGQAQWDAMETAFPSDGVLHIQTCTKRLYMVIQAPKYGRQEFVLGDGDGVDPVVLLGPRAVLSIKTEDLGDDVTLEWIQDIQIRDSNGMSVDYEAAEVTSTFTEDGMVSTGQLLLLVSGDVRLRLPPLPHVGALKERTAHLRLGETCGIQLGEEDVL